MSETVDLSVSLPVPDTSAPTTEPSNPSTVVIAPLPSGNGDATTADLLARVRVLEERLALTSRQAEEATSLAAEASLTATLATIENTPTEEPVTEMVVPESSDSGPPASEKEKPPQKKGWLHHWI